MKMEDENDDKSLVSSPDGIGSMARNAMSVRRESKCGGGSSSDSDSSEDEGDSDTDVLWKRCKKSRQKPQVGSDKTSFEHGANFTSTAKRFSDDRFRAGKPVSRFSVWSNVLLEQDMVENLNAVGVQPTDGTNDRGCEGYCYKPYRDFDGERDRGYQKFRDGRKRHYKDLKFGYPVSVVQKPRSPPFQVTESDSDETVAANIAVVINEPKKELIERVVKYLGRKKALDLLAMTENIEDCGGLMTVNGSRRRTPGGVYLLLLKSDDDVRKDDKDKIFEDDKKEQAQVRKQVVQARRRRLAAATAHDETGLKPLPNMIDLVLQQSGEACIQMDVPREEGEDSSSVPCAKVEDMGDVSSPESGELTD